MSIGDTMNQLLRGEAVERPERVGLSMTDEHAEMNAALRGEAEDVSPRDREGLPGPTEPEPIDSRTMNQRLRDVRDARRQYDHSGRTG